ncbi:elongation factor 4 [candidate division WOR-1 bacterium RIFCSPLOWO2_02_FULL_46_20]|uniref:Elongation factor 4 n=2 Tax=Saganbacteria TaxID=1703751 RepID=A0A1F4RBD0_UNCSA|nr:MAG: elongation factor 4 [candidate division WOR-1 bacterium RIFCSPHIGHO2_02_FULL_45_12]OGC05426.1 MAG: elongation factor 4 [candidate division WOR-1 bacterium RIFCSPLOWO2_02_FULL_46_20]OGC08995.1 MAG: elongation factor 4 [candidate division WOR-1 bacterium RIFCSPLOWO2_12_FULL_45_9]
MQSKIRNFSIIAHIDHGKSTLADRLLEYTRTIDKRNMREQVLDSMELERERGITIKSQAIRMKYKGYILNLIDTPGHVDFSYEVSRSLAACEGALLIVDATQGIEAQTLANTNLALANNLKIIPVINKIDLPGAEVQMAKEELMHTLGFAENEILLASAKEGTGIEEILKAIIDKVPPPQGDENKPLQALIFDSHYDTYRGVIVYIKVVNGRLNTGDNILFMGTGKKFEALEIGTFCLSLIPKTALESGEVGYLIANIKNIADAHVGDTITTVTQGAQKALAGYRPIKPMVFCGFYPINGEEYEALKEALEKLQLNDAALFYEAETSAALGFGFRCGFLGLLHMEITQQRLAREFNLGLIATTPNVIYKINLNNKKSIQIDNPTKFPDASTVASIEEPYFKVSIFTPSEYVGAIMQLATDKRGNFINLEYIDQKRAIITYEMPLSEVIIEFHDLLKSVSRGYASMDYEQIGYKASDLVKLDILINQEPVDALSFIVHRDRAQYYGRKLCERLVEEIPRQMFSIPIQAAVGSKVIARETVTAKRKDVLAKCYGGDVSRKRKLLEKQKEGKKKMKRIGKVDIPQEAFLAVLRLNK